MPLCGAGARDGGGRRTDHAVADSLSRTGGLAARPASCGRVAVTDADVIIVGAGPAGLMLAGELGLAGVRPLVLERQPRPREIPKASGCNGQIVALLRYRACWTGSRRPAAVPPARLLGPRSGGIQLDFSPLADPPMWVVPLPQPQLERV